MFSFEPQTRNLPCGHTLVLFLIVGQIYVIQWYVNSSGLWTTASFHRLYWSQIHQRTKIWVVIKILFQTALIFTTCTHTFIRLWLKNSTMFKTSGWQLISHFKWPCHDCRFFKLPTLKMLCTFTGANEPRTPSWTSETILPYKQEDDCTNLSSFGSKTIMISPMMKL